MVSSDLYEIAEKCGNIPLCKEQMAEHIENMSRAVDAAREYYDELKKGGGEDAVFIRDRAFEISRAVRTKYLINPDPKIKTFTEEQVQKLIDAQWNLYFIDFVEIKRLCDEATPYMKTLSIYENNCEEDLWQPMLTFNFTGDEPEGSSGLQTVCDLEKNYLNTASCPITLSKAEAARKEFYNYLSTHKNPYYSVSELPDERADTVATADSEQSKVVSGFYDALSEGRGDLAVKFITPKKQETGTYTSAGLTKYWSNLLVPLGVLQMEASDENVYEVGYMYQARGKETCIDKAKVELEQVEGSWYISRITPEEGC
jgi:hypothetical protein